jgi:hypothetical protein
MRNDYDIGMMVSHTDKSQLAHHLATVVSSLWFLFTTARYLTNYAIFLW